jgi:hypothetical protein
VAGSEEKSPIQRRPEIILEVSASDGNLQTSLIREIRVLEGNLRLHDEEDRSYLSEAS